MTETKPPPRRERERMRHRQEILDAARKILASRGLEGVTVEGVAKESEFAVGSIYRHFRSKEELIEELLQDLADAHFEELEALNHQGLSFLEHLNAAIRLSAESQEESIPLLLAILNAPGPAPMPGTPAGERLRNMGLRAMAVFDGIVQRGQDEGALKPGPRTNMVLALMGILNSFGRASMLTGSSVEGELSDAVIAVFLDGARQRGAS